MSETEQLEVEATLAFNESSEEDEFAYRQTPGNVEVAWSDDNSVTLTVEDTSEGSEGVVEIVTVYLDSYSAAVLAARLASIAAASAPDYERAIRNAQEAAA